MFHTWKSAKHIGSGSLIGIGITGFIFEHIGHTVTE